MIRFLKKLLGWRDWPAGYPHLDDVDVDINVTWAGTQPQYTWDIKDNGFKGGSDGKKIKPKQNKGCLIHFELKRTTGSIRFDAAAPIYYSDDISGCPSTFPTDGQLLVVRCDANDLEIIDWNSVAGELRYQINFISESGERLPALDPIIMNGGGGIKPQ